MKIKEEQKLNIAHKNVFKKFFFIKSIKILLLYLTV